jgi:hypothetical protein
MLNKAICLCCCKERLKHEFAFYESIFDDFWKIGVVDCGRQQAWIWLTDGPKTKRAKSMTFEGIGGAYNKKLNDELISKCPYLLEHTVNA